MKINEIDEKLLKLIKTPKFKEIQVSIPEKSFKLIDKFCTGERHNKMVQIAGALSRQGLDEQALIESLFSLNETLCDDPLSQNEIIEIGQSIFKYQNYKGNSKLFKQNNSDELQDLIFTNKGNKNERYQKISDFIIKELSHRGEFVKTTTGNCYFFDNTEKILLPIFSENISYKCMLAKFKINPQMPVYKFITEALQIHCNEMAKLVNVYKYAHYDKIKNILYLKRTDTEMYRISASHVTLCHNGTDEILFSDTINIDEYFYIEELENTDYITKHVTSLCNFNNSAINQETQATLIKAFFISLLMPELLQTKPILTIIGTKGSAKTTILKAFLKILYGEKHNVCSMPNKLDDLDILAVNSHFLAIDNLDGYKTDLNDKLAVYSTGGTIKKRRLYTDAEVYEAELDTFIGITTRNLVSKRDDVLQRLILIELAPIAGGYKDEDSVMQPIKKYRNEIISQAINEVQRIMNLIETKKYASEKSIFRMADFAKFLTYLLDDHKAAETHLSNELKYQQTMTIENDILLGYLAAFTLTCGEKYYTAHEIYELIVLDAKDEKYPYLKTDFEKSYESVNSFAKRLNNIKNDIEEYVIIQTRKGRGNQTEYYLKPGPNFDQVDQIQINKKNLAKSIEEII